MKSTLPYLKRLVLFSLLWLGLSNLHAIPSSVDPWGFSQRAEDQEGVQLLRTGKFPEVIEFAKKRLQVNANDATAVTLLSLANLGLGNDEQALSEAALCARMNPAQGFVTYQGLARFYQQKQRPFRALVVARRALEIRPDADLAELASSVYLAQGRLGEAKAVLARSPSQVSADISLARIRLVEAKYEGAVEAGERAAAVQPSNPGIQLILASAYLVLDQLDSAQRCYERARAIQPDFRDADYYLALVDLARNQAGKAVQRLSALTRQTPPHKQALLATTIAQLGMGDLDAAEKTASEVLKLAPEDPLAHLAMGCLRVSQQRVGDADHEFRGANGLYLDFVLPGFNSAQELQASATFKPADFALANLFVMEGLPHAVRRIAGASRNRLLAVAKARADMKLKDWDAGRKRLTAATSTGTPPLLCGWIQLGELEAAAGDRLAAIKAFQKAVQISGKMPGTQLRLGNLYYEGADYDNAISSFRQVIALAPQASVGYNQLAWVLAEKKGSYVEALGYAKQGLALEGENIGIRDTLGWIYYLSGRQAEAAKVYREIMSKPIQNPGVWYRIALVLGQAGEKDQAAKCFEQALNLSTSFPEASKAASALDVSLP